MILYRPLGTHPGRFFGYELTMAVYVIVAAAAAFSAITLLKKLDYFSQSVNWTIGKELIVMVITILTFGVAAYLTGFVMEDPGDRLDWATFLNSLTSAFLVGLIPFLFFTAMNLRYWLFEEQALELNGKVTGQQQEELIKISSQLKKEELSFFPSQFIYAESEGNYVNFFLYSDNKLRREVIRNSISSVEQQLSKVPYIFRTHRAFIVNLRKIKTKKGNALGYRLRLAEIDNEIPVARNNTRDFNLRLKQI